MAMPVCTPEALQLLQEGALTFSRMEAAGLRVNMEYVDRKTIELRREIADQIENFKTLELYKQWQKYFGQRTNLNAREQLGTILYDVMGYKATGLTGKGKKSTDVDALDDLDLPEVNKYLEIQTKNKSLNTYFGGIKRETVEENGAHYIHPFFNLNTTVTYRSSSNAPNLHNIPKRKPEMAALLRPSFMPHPGHVLVEGDFSQLEVRIAACYHKDPAMMKYIKDETTDMHGDTAMKLYLLPKDQICKKTTRDASKNQFVFPEFYGSVYANCARNIWKSMRRRDFRVGKNNDGITIREHLAKKGITELGQCIIGREPVKGTFEYLVKQTEDYFWKQMFPVYTRWKRDWFDTYRKNGYFKMHSGFVIRWGSYAKNEVINYPVQGSAFHCLLWCLIKIDKWLRKYKMRSKLINEIHDSLIASVHPDELQDFLEYCHNLMTVELPKAWKWINVPLQAEFDVTGVDGNWHTAKEWKKINGTWQLAA